MNKNDSIVITFLDARPNHDHRLVKANDKIIGFAALDDDSIRLEKCFQCNKENYAPAVMDGACAWCGWDANNHE